MEFAQGRRGREGYDYCEIVDDEQDDSAKHWGGQPGSASAAAAAEAPSSSSAPVEKEHMFDKVVTPSDVGKLNRLVIPKQHAEKYFPLDTTTHEKGLLLNFEDRTGKPWRFRYSYWNSSQSYVMTKGWSRFVKEKRLDAGDTVSFGRGVDDKDRLFIDWKRRPEIQEPPWSAMTPRIPLPLPPSSYPMVSFTTRSVGPWAGRLLVPPTAVYDGHRQNYVYNAAGSGGGGAGGGQYLFFRSAAPPPHAALQQFGSGRYGGEQDARLGSPMVLESVPVVQSQAAAKRVRLFGVNLDCPDTSTTTTTSDGDAGDSSIRSAAFSSSPSPSPKGKEKEELSLDLDM